MMRALAIAGMLALFALSLALFAGVVPTPTIHFPGIVPLVMLLCVGGMFWAVRR